MTAASIEQFIRGAHHLVYRPDGLVRPARLSKKQVDAADAAGRKRAAVSSSGVTIDLVTTGDEASFDLSVLEGLDPSSGTVVETLACAAPDETRLPDEGLVDGVDLVVNGVYVRTVPAREGTVVLRFDNPNHVPAEVRIYLPCIMSVAVGNLATNGTLEPAPCRGYLLALGDSISQGHIVGAPSASWPARLSRALGLDLVNQAISGHVFDRATLRGMRLLRENPPELITVAYGTNDWAHEEADLILANMRAYLDRLTERFPGVPVYVLSPIWRRDQDRERPNDKSLDWVRAALREECAHLCLRYVEGAGVVPADPAWFADGRLHPNARGAALVCDAMVAALEEDGLLGQITGGGRMDAPASRADEQTLMREGAPGEHARFDEVVRTIWRLRQPDGCPWDRKQTHASIAKNMIEEAYEAVDAIEAGDAFHLREELGDVLMQVLLHAQIAADAGEFTIDDVCHDLNEKLVRRHPHVFGEGVTASDAGEVLDIWSKVKLAERQQAKDAAQAQGQDAQGGAVQAEGAGDAARPAAPGLMDAVPRSLPALMQAQKISKKAVACGFDWDSTEDVWAQLDAERAEFAAEQPGSDGALEEFGDVLFTAVNVARREGLDAETALRRSCEKFRSRWAKMENLCAERGLAIEDCPRDVLEDLWVEAKATESGRGSNLV